MTYDDLIRDLWRRGHGKGMRLGLDRVRAASKRLGDPAAAYPAVHVAGTNGKGSVCHMIARMLHAHGLRVGVTTSPHLHRLTERIRIDGQEAVRDELTAAANEAFARLGGWDAFDLTFFEVVTLIAFEVFRRREVDVAVVEVGMGGRLDATRLCRPVVSAITTVALDHTEHLGPTISAIAAEKAAIAVRGIPMVIGRLAPEAMEVAARIAAEACAPMVRAQAGAPDPPLPGEHQRANAAVATAAARIAIEALGLRPDPDRMRLRPFVLPGRFERIEGAPPVVFDVAHNPEGAAALAAHLRAESIPVRFVVGVLAVKDIEGILAPLRLAGRPVHACAPAVPGAAPPDRIAAIWGDGAEVHASVVAAFDLACERARKPGETVVVTGSHFTVAEARARRLGIVDVDRPIAL